MGIPFENLETGEQFFLTSYTTDEEANAWKEKKEKIASRNGSAFTFTDMGEVQQLKEGNAMENDGLTAKELGYYLVLQTYMSFDNILFKSSHAIKPMNRGTIGEVLGISNRSAVKKTVDKFLEKGLLSNQDYTLEDGKTVECFVINEQYHFKGKSKNRPVLKLFSTKIRELYKQVGAGDLGFIYSLLPYVHFEQNILCTNPHELNSRLVNVLTLQDIVDITGVSSREVRRKISQLTFDGMGCIKIEISLGKRCYRVNPFVIYRKDGEPPKLLRDSFLIQGK